MCDETKRLIGEVNESSKVGGIGDELSAALEHLRRCQACRLEIPAEERAKFVRAVVLSR